MLVDGVNGYASTPDNPSLELTGDVQTWIYRKVVATDWSPSLTKAIGAHRDFGVNQSSWLIVVDFSPTSGRFSIYLSANGSVITEYSSTESPTVADGGSLDLKIERVSATGVITFYVDLDGTGFVQLGDTVTGITGNLHNSTAALTVGCQLNSGAVTDPWVGSIGSFELYDDDTLACEFNAADGGNKNGLASDTFETVIPDSEQVINTGLSGGFSSAEDWGANSNGTVSVVGNTLRVTQTGQVGSVTYTLTYGSNYDLVDGVRYRCRLKRPVGDPGVINLRYIDNSPNIATNLAAGVDHVIDFVKSDTSTGLELAKAGIQDDYFSLEYFSIEEINQFTLHGNAFIQNLGHTVANTFGGAGMETTAGQTLSTDLTVFMVAKAHTLPSATQILIGARSNSAASLFLYTDALNNFTADAGAVNVIRAGDTGWHLWAVRYNRDGTSGIQIDNETPDVATIGAEDWDFATLFASPTGGDTLNGAIANLTVIPRALTDTEYDQIKNDLINFYGIAA